MPYLQVCTNVPKEKITEKTTMDLTNVIAESLNKPKGYCVVHILPGNCFI